jgi:hypothetical protein
MVMRSSLFRLRDTNRKLERTVVGVRLEDARF